MLDASVTVTSTNNSFTRYWCSKIAELLFRWPLLRICLNWTEIKHFEHYLEAAIVLSMLVPEFHSFSSKREKNDYAPKNHCNIFKTIEYLRLHLSVRYLVTQKPVAHVGT